MKFFVKSRRMNGGNFIPTNAVKPNFTQPPTLVTMPPLQQSTTTGTSIFVQTPNNMVQGQPEIGTISNFCPLFTPVGRKFLNNYLSPNHPECQNQKRKQMIGMETYKRREKEQKEKELQNNNFKAPQSNPKSIEIFNIHNNFKDMETESA